MSHRMLLVKGGSERVVREYSVGLVVENDDVVERLRRAALGRGDEQTAQLLSRVVGNMVTDRSPIQCLSDRELQAFEMMGQGLTTEHIAEKMHVSP